MRGERRSATREFVNRLREGPLKSIGLRELVRVDGYADRIAKETNIAQVQLRKIYADLRHALGLMKGGNPERGLSHIWMLYPLLEYQCKRKNITEEFRDMMQGILENIERYNDRENIETVEKFMMALVAYSKKG